MADYDMTRDAWMKNQQRFQEAAEGRWQWPLLDLAGYDRRVVPDGGEQAALREFAERIEGGRSREAYRLLLAATLAETSLTRLVMPLCDLLDVIGSTKSRRHMTMRVLLLEVYRRQSVYWGWQRTDWFEILGEDAEVFWKRHHVARECRQQVIAASYLLGDCTNFRPHLIDHVVLARTVFGMPSVERAIWQVEEGLRQMGAPVFAQLPRLLCQVLLTNHSPRLSAISYECLVTVYEQELPHGWKRELVRISTLLGRLGISDRVLPFGIRSEWMNWCQRWYATSTIEYRTRRSYYTHLLRVGRWLSQNYPDVHSPSEWTVALTQAFVQEVDRLVAGQWSIRRPTLRGTEQSLEGTRLATEAKINYFQMLRTFFRDCRQWGWFQVEFDGDHLPWSREGAALEELPRPRQG
jgi:hypothetical protein